MRRISKGMKKSRLSKYVLYRCTGVMKDLGFTCSFKPVIIRFKTIRDWRAIISSNHDWYIVKKSSTNPIIVVSIADLSPLSELDLIDLGSRMRMRFLKLLREVGRKGGRIDKRMRVVTVEKMPRLVELLEYELALLLLKSGGVVEYERLPYASILAKLRKKQNMH